MIPADIFSYLTVALERTFLSYLRTSSILALTGVMIAQLHMLQQSDKTLERYEPGMVLAMACYASATWILLCGACRFMRFQQALVRGKSLVGGLELMSPAILIFTVSFIFEPYTKAYYRGAIDS